MGWLSDTLKSVVRSPLVNLLPGGHLIGAGVRAYDAVKHPQKAAAKAKSVGDMMGQDPRMMQWGQDLATGAMGGMAVKSVQPNVAKAVIKPAATSAAKKAAKGAGKVLATDAVFDIAMGDETSTARQIYDLGKESIKDYFKTRAVNSTWDKLKDRVPEKYRDKAEDSLTKRGYLKEVSKPTVNSIVNQSKTKGGNNNAKDNKRKKTSEAGKKSGSRDKKRSRKKGSRGRGLSG